MMMMMAMMLGSYNILVTSYLHPRSLLEVTRMQVDLPILGTSFLHPRNPREVTRMQVELPHTWYFIVASA